MNSSAKRDERKKQKETTSLNAYFFSFDVYILHGRGRRGYSGEN